MIVRNEDNAAGWNDFHQRFTNQLCIRICEAFARDLPHFAVKSAQAFADRIEFCTRCQ